MSFAGTLAASLAAASIGLALSGTIDQVPQDTGVESIIQSSTSGAAPDVSFEMNGTTVDQEAIEEMFGDGVSVSVSNSGVLITSGGHMPMWLTWKQWGCVAAIAGYVGANVAAVMGLFITGGMSVVAVLAYYGIASAGVVTACYNADGSPVF